MGADLPALAAADAQLLGHVGLAGVVLLHLTGAAAAAHADIFQAAAEAGLFMSLKMSQRDKHIGVHNGAADLGVLHILAADHGNLYLIAALQAVGNDDLVWWCYPIAEVFSLTLTLLFFRHVYRTMIARIPEGAE